MKNLKEGVVRPYTEDHSPLVMFVVLIWSYLKDWCYRTFVPDAEGRTLLSDITLGLYAGLIIFGAVIILNMVWMIILHLLHVVIEIINTVK